MALNNQELLLETWAAEIQELETASFEVLTERALDTAVGVQLDGLGQIIGRDRQGETDDVYRRLLSSQIRLNLSSGVVDEILEIVALTIPGITLVMVQEFPAAFEIEANEEVLPAGIGPIVAALVKDAKAGGVKGLFQFFETAPLFKFDGADGTQFDGGSYFGTSL